MSDTPADDLRLQVDDSFQDFLHDYNHGLQTAKDLGQNIEYHTFDSQVKFLDDLMQLIAQHEAKLLQSLLAEMPKPKDAEFESNLKVIGLHEQYVKGHNQAIEQMTAAIKALQKVREG